MARSREAPTLPIDMKLRLARQRNSQLAALFEHYANGAGKTTPVASVAANMGISEKAARDGLAKLGRHF